MRSGHWKMIVSNNLNGESKSSKTIFLFFTAAPASGSRVSIQLQVRYRQRNGQMMLRVISSERTVTDDR